MWIAQCYVTYLTRTARISGMGCFFFFNDTATTEIYTLSLHDALPIWRADAVLRFAPNRSWALQSFCGTAELTFPRDRKSTRLNSSHLVISYAVFCLKKKNRCSSRPCTHLHVETLLLPECASLLQLCVS